MGRVPAARGEMELSELNRLREVCRRDFLKYGLVGFTTLLGPSLFAGCDAGNNGGGSGNPLAPGPGVTSNIENLGPLQSADANGVQMPVGFTSRVVARSGQEPVVGSGFNWHDAPDGGATYATPDGGFVYVSNSEETGGAGGVGALKFDSFATVEDAYSILRGTSKNCGGGKTPWDTWLSCEENGESGRVYDCDPTGQQAAIVRPALGSFNHEAVAVDSVNHVLYLTEDRSDGGFYRFVPDQLTGQGYADLSTGTLQVAGVTGGGPEGAVVWHPIPDPSASMTSTRNQIAKMTTFNGGEGIDFKNPNVYFTTKGDNRVWCYDTASNTLLILYDDTTNSNPILTGVDNLLIGADGDLLVAEDGGDLQIVAITPLGTVLPVIQLSGHDSSEITGPAFDPGGTRLYFSSQRGTTGNSSDGMTFEVTGPFVV